MKKNQMIPTPFNPLHSMMTGGVPGLPDIIKNVIPVNTPQMRYEQNPISMIYGNFKLIRLAKAKAIEAQIAASSNATVISNLNSIHAFITSSASCADTLNQYEHQRIMRDEEKETSRLTNKKLEAEVTKLGYETAILANEVKLGNLELEIKTRQMQRILDDGER